MPNRKAENIFNACLIIAMIVVLVMAFEYNARARLFPLIFSSLIIFMTGLHMMMVNMKNPPKFLHFVTKSGALTNYAVKEETSDGMDQQEQALKSSEEIKASDDELTWGNIFYIFLWLTLFVISIVFIHYLLATLIFLILFMRFVGKVRWKTTLYFSFILTGSLYFLFEILLSAQQ